MAGVNQSLCHVIREAQQPVPLYHLRHPPLPRRAINEATGNDLAFPVGMTTVVATLNEGRT